MKNSLILSKHNTTFTSIPEGSEGFILSELYHMHSSSIIHVVRDDHHMDALSETLRFFAPDIPILTLPGWDCLPYDRVSPNNKIISKRIETLFKLIIDSTATKRIIITTINSLLQRMPPIEVLKNAVLHAKIGDALSRDALTMFLVNNGYTRTGNVNEPGEFAVRGSIIDIFSSYDGGAEYGIRLDFFGDNLESIRIFDPVTQISGEKLTEFTLLPASEVILSPDAIHHFRKSYCEMFGVSGNSDLLYDSISEGRKYVGMEHWLPLFYSHTDSLFDYVPESIITYQHLVEEAGHERLALIEDYYQARKETEVRPLGETSIYHPIPPKLLYLGQEEWDQHLINRKIAHFYPFQKADSANEEAVRSLPLKPVRNFAADSVTDNSSVFELLKKHIQESRIHNAKSKLKNPKVLISCYSIGSRDRLQHMLQSHDMHTMMIDSWNEYSTISGKTIGLMVLGLESGFETENFLIISEQDLLGERVIRPTKTRKRMENFLKEATSLLPDELIVHKEHGIGRFEGIETLTVSGVAHDCLRILYDGGDKLYVPVENIDTINRYGNDEEGIRLDKLGGASWQSRKARLRQRIKIAAEALLKIAAERALKSGTVVTPLKGLYDEFCARFPYAETEDQLSAINDIETDLASGKPMDRLICGDVGFGKTEVALRAAFMAVLSEEAQSGSSEKIQVAVVVPTTLLCRQHYATFKKRFAGFPVRIRQLSRLVTGKEAAETHKLLENGEVDIIIGTHAILSKSIRFKNLGMLIVDEEQHFGVAQKEQLKQFKASIHVLTLSATPIPRTLQMSLVGIRELSLIATPPIDRLAVRTFVMPFDPVVIREAILREHYRGGRSFYVCPRIKDLADIEKTLKTLVPEVKIVVAHGQMPAAQLDDIMNAFYDGKYDLLLSTTIVESGLDVPSANTIILHRSDMLGLSQLYQLRGRVGRGKTRAYAYLTLPPRKVPSKMALKRLEVMEKLDSLGAGFSLASHDMDIRGFGNLVGDEQSGHIREVGIELYQEMLQEAVETAKFEQFHEEEKLKKDSWSPQINIGISVQIPESYVSDLSLRLGLYRRVADLKTEQQVEEIAAEMIDRFGPLPEEAKHLLEIVRLKQLCLEGGIEKIDTGPKGAVITFRNNSFAKPEKLIEFISKNSHSTKIRSDHKLVLMESWEDAAKRMRGVNKMLKDIVTMAA